MHGGLSQLESWDPKPGTETGGPFRAISTSVPGIQISELLPNVARQMHHLCLVRGVNTSEDDHGKGAYLMITGRRQTPAADYPNFGAVCAKAMAPDDSALPGHIVITPGGGGGRGNDSAYLGPKYASIHLGNGKPPRNTTRPGQVTEPMDAARNAFRRTGQRPVPQPPPHGRHRSLHLFLRTGAPVDGAAGVFDVTKEPAKDHDRYGKYDFGRHCLLARRLLEKGATFVQVSHSNYDTHNENFNFHIEQLGEFDRSFAAFVADLADRGMLESTLIVVLSEFGRTPQHQPVLRPRSLVARLDGGDGRRQGPSRGGLRQDERQGHGSRRRPGRSRQPVPHLPPGRGGRLDRLVRYRGPRRPDGRPGLEDDPKQILTLIAAHLLEMTEIRHDDARHAIPAGFDPKQAHVVAQWPAGRPMVCCRFEPRGRFLFCGLESSTLQRFNLADGKKVRPAGRA